MVEAFGRAAAMAVGAGLDGVELHGAQGYLIHQSLSPWGNGRHDEWGEHLALVRAVLEATRESIGRKGFWAAVVDDRTPEEGSQSEDGLATVVRDIVRMGYVDFVNIGLGSKVPQYTTRMAATYRHAEDADLCLPRRSAV